MNNTSILFSIESGVATITLNRPETLNAFNSDMIAAATSAFKQCGKDRSIRSVVLTGSGRGFSSGQDLKEVQNRPEELSLSAHLRTTYHQLIKQMIRLEKPIIGAINGVVAGAGCGVALATDIRIASESARFVLAFSRVGLIPDSGTNWFLPRIIGYARAYEMAVTASKVPAEQALAWGMVNRVVPPDEVMPVSMDLARQLAQGPTVAFGLTKRAMNKAWTSTLDEALTYEAYLQEIAGRTEDRTEGINAFLEKRPAQYKGQ